MRHIPNKKGICAHIFDVRALDAKQMINFFWPQLVHDSNFCSVPFRKCVSKTPSLQLRALVTLT